jgi:hypothetical protein
MYSASPRPGPDVRLDDEHLAHTPPPRAAASVVVVAPIERDRFSASFGGRVLVEASATPFLDAARVLAGEGVDPATRIVMRHRGKNYDALTSTVGAAVKLRVEEGDGVPRFRRWRPSPYGRGTPGRVSDEVAAITSMEAPAASTAAPPTDVHRAIDADRYQTGGGNAAHASEPVEGAEAPPQPSGALGGAAAGAFPHPNAASRGKGSGA